MRIRNLYHVFTMVENLFNAKDGRVADPDIQNRLLELKNQAGMVIKKYPAGSFATAIVTGFIIGQILKK